MTSIAASSTTAYPRSRSVARIVVFPALRRRRHWNTRPDGVGQWQCQDNTLYRGILASGHPLGTLTLPGSPSVDGVDSDTAINIVAIIISTVSLAVSGVLAIRQNRTAAAGYALPVILEIFGQFRTQEFFEARRYVFDELNNDFKHPVAYTELPVDVLAKVRMVAGRYDDLGKLVAHGIVGEELIIGSNGTAIQRVWQSVAPYVREERRKRGTLTWAYLEDLAYRASRKPPKEIYAKLGLHRHAKT